LITPIPTQSMTIGANRLKCKENAMKNLPNPWPYPYPKCILNKMHALEVSGNLHPGRIASIICVGRIMNSNQGNSTFKLPSRFTIGVMP